MSDSPATPDHDGEPDPAPDHESGEGAGGGGGRPGLAPQAQRQTLVERAAAKGVQPSPPPRRTGVFVDVEDLREFVAAQLRAMLGGYEVDALGNMTFTAEGARIFVTVGAGPFGPQVGVFSITNLGVELAPELAAWLVTTNHRLAFGAFSYDAEQSAVWFRHSLLGGTLDGPELRGAVIAVATTAAKVSPMIGEKFGGGRFEDEPEDVQRTVHPPEHQPDDDPVNASGYL